MVKEARGDAVLPELARKAVGDSRVRGRNLCSLVAPVGCGLGEKGEETRAVNRAQSQRVMDAASTRIEAK